MIVQTKETKTKNPLIELLGGSQKKGAAQNDAFSKLLATLAEGLKGEKSGIVTASPAISEPNKAIQAQFNAVIDPKKSKESPLLRQPAEKGKGTAILQQLLSGTEKIPNASTIASLQSSEKSKNTAALQHLLSGTDKIQNSSQLTSLQTPEKNEETAVLQELLSGNEGVHDQLFSKALLDTLGNDQVRNLIYRAKEYLKNEITAKAPELSAESKSLPKTLIGLIQLADKMGLNPQSVTLSTLITNPDEQAAFSPAILSEPLLDAKTLSTLPLKTPSSPAFEVITQLLREGKEKDFTPKNESKNDVLKEGKKEVRIEQPLNTLLQKTDKSQEALADTGSKENLHQPAEQKAPVSPKTDGLITLLQGENAQKEKEGQSISTPKNDADLSKTHQIPKADALEVKTKEASQSMRYFASDLKEAVQEYKPPFTRLTMTLNPEKLGEVEVTLVQRGNNVHVNIQSNNANSVAFLAHNATELKAQLAAQGITNATMNFMSGGEGQAQQQGQQQQQHNRFRAYQSLEDLELNQEQLSALEIIIPHYA